MAEVGSKIQAAFNAEVKKTNMSMEAQREIQEAINAGAVKNVKELQNILHIVKQVTRGHRDVNKELSKADQLVQDIADGEYKLIDITSTLQKSVKGNRKEFIGIGAAAKDVQKTLLVSYKAQLKSGALTKQAYKELVKIANESLDIAKNMELIARSDLAEPFDEAISLADKMATKMEGVFDSIPGGKYLFKALGGDVLKDQLKKAVTKGFAAMAASMKMNGTMLQAMTAGMRAFNVAVMANPMILVIAAIVAAAAAVAALVAVYTNVSHKAHELSTATGLTYAQTKKIVKASNDVVASSGNQLSLQKDILAVMTETVKEFGVMGMMSAKQAGAVSDIGIAFGYGAEQAGKVNNAFMRMGATADEAANTQRDLAAEAMKAGVSVGAVTADIAENSKTTSKYFGGNVKALKKAAIEAAKMGVSLSTMAKVSDSLLDFEKSISAQFELQALTGKNMNLDGARRLALEGDIAGATAAVLDQVGSIAEFDKLGYLERKKLAEATGMDVGELQKSLIIKSKMGDLDNDQLASMTALGLTAAQMNDMSAEDLQKKLASKQASEKIAAQFAAMKATLVNALMPAAEAMMSTFVMLSPVLKGIGALIGVILAPLKAMGDILSGNTSEMSVFQKVLGGIVIAMTGLKLTTLAINGYYAAGNALAAMRGTLTNKEYIKKVAIGGLEKAGNVLKTFGNFLMSTRVTTAVALTAAEGTSNALKVTGNVSEGITTAAKSTQLGLGAGIAAAQAATATSTIAATAGQVTLAGATGVAASAQAGLAAAALVTNAAMTFGIGTVIAIAAAGVAIGALAGYMMSGDDVMSPPSGGAGYGSRTLFGPEGAISFNNKDTIVAGTDLFSQANDAVFAPKGAMKMNDGAVNAPDVKDPPELKLVGIANQSVAKLSMGIAAALGLAVAPAFISALALSMPVIALTITSAVAAGMALSMPFIGAAIIGGITAGALATALIPKPVLILNPILPTFETNPVMMMGAMLGGIGNLLGGGKSKDDKEDAVTMKDVVTAISNITIEMDGQKVGATIRLADTFRRG